jgi:hypothetical protein
MMPKDSARSVAEALNNVIKVLSDLDEPSRARVLNSVAIFFGHAPSSHSVTNDAPSLGNVDHQLRPAFSDERTISPKDFMFQKQPKTDIERIACLAFYLTHFRNMLHFKTLDLAKLNTEAAQIKFSNVSYATENATKAGYLATAARGTKQITSWGEQFVVALPDREAALKAISQARKRKGPRPKK